MNSIKLIYYSTILSYCGFAPLLIFDKQGCNSVGLTTFLFPLPYYSKKSIPKAIFLFKGKSHSNAGLFSHLLTINLSGNLSQPGCLRSACGVPRLLVDAYSQKKAPALRHKTSPAPQKIGRPGKKQS